MSSNPNDELCEAASKGSLSIVRMLLEEGVNPALPDSTGYHALGAAAAAGHVDVVECLLDYNSRLDSSIDKDEATPLIRAAQAGHAEVCEVILSRNYRNTWQIDRRGMDALMYAARSGYTDVVQVLLKYHADPNKKRIIDLLDEENNPSALSYAVQGGYTEIVKLLLGHHTKVDKWTIEIIDEMERGNENPEITKLVRSHIPRKNGGPIKGPGQKLGEPSEQTDKSLVETK